MVPSTLDMEPSTLDPRHKDRLVSVEQYFTFFDRFTSNFRSMVVIKPCTGVKTGINGVNRNSVTSSCWFFFFFLKLDFSKLLSGRKILPKSFCPN